jgi:hypothetical protein
VVRVYATAERADKLLLFLFFPYMYSVEQTVSEREKIESFISQLRGTGDVILAGAMWGQTTEYTQNGNGHFLAYISSGWKNHYIYLLH